MTMQLASSKCAGLFGIVVRTFERNAIYQHCELVFSDSVSFSCVGNEGIKAFGVRKKRIVFDDGWDLIDLPFIGAASEQRMRDYAEGMRGKPYDFASLAGVMFRAGRLLPNAYICSECVQLILAYQGWWESEMDRFVTPTELARMVATDPPDDGYVRDGAIWRKAA